MDLKIDTIKPSARLPKVIELVILSDIRQLPFSENDFSQTEAVNLWKSTSNRQLAFKKSAKFDLNLKMVVNGIEEMAYRYKLTTIIWEDLCDEFDESFEVNCIKYLLERD